jgi:O-antigen ligase
LKIKFNIVNIIFWSLAAIIFCNLNGLFSLIGAPAAIMSPLILLFSLSLFLMGIIKKSYLKVDYYLFVSTLIVFFILASISGLFYYGDTTFKFSFIWIEFRNVITTIIIFSIFYCFAKRKIKSGTLRPFLKGIMLLFLFTLCFGVFESVIGLRSAHNVIRDPNRSLGFFGNPNETGFQANLALVIILAYYLLNKARNSIIYLPLTGLCIYGAFSSFSKSAIVSCAIILILILFFSIKQIFQLNFKSRFLYVVGIFIGITSFVIIPRVEGYYEELSLSQQKRISGTIDLAIKGEFNSRTTSSRSKVFADAFEIIKRKPIFGNGLYTFSIGGSFASSPTHGVHNVYLKILGEGGIFALLMFLVFIFYFLLNGITLKSLELQFLCVGTIAAFCLYAFGTHGALYNKFSIAFLGIISAISSSNELRS